MAIEVTKQIYMPSMTVGQVYARVYGSQALPMPIGNVLELGLEHSEDVQTQEDMTALGGGTHAEVRRVKEVKLKAKLADLNVVNLARSVLGTVESIGAGTKTDEPHVATLGGLLPLEHISPTNVVVKKGDTAAAATSVDMALNYEVRHEGIYLLPDAKDVLATDKLWVSYGYGAYAAIEALTTKSVELELAIDRKLFEKNPNKLIKLKEKQMTEAVKVLDFETAALLRDEINLLKIKSAKK